MAATGWNHGANNIRRCLKGDLAMSAGLYALKYGLALLYLSARTVEKTIIILV
jgi:hypothetical protein